MIFASAESDYILYAIKFLKENNGVDINHNDDNFKNITIFNFVHFIGHNCMHIK